jgi:iron complex outermembrane receptor protein
MAGGSWGSIRGYEEYRKMLAGFRIESRLGSNLTNTLILFSSVGDPMERRPFNTLDEEALNIGFREYVEYRTKQVRMSAGLEYFHEWFRWRTYETLPEGRGPKLSDQKERRRYLNSFLLAQWRPGERLLVDAGVNLNLLGYNLETGFRADSTDQSGSYGYDPVVSPRLGLSYRHNRELWTYVSAGHGFSAPSLEETLMPEGSVNTSLRPETGWNVEIGNRGSLFGRHLDYDVALYSVILLDMLVTERTAEDVFTGVNAGSALNTGLEAFLRGQLYPGADKEGFNAHLAMGFSLSRNVFLDFVEDDGDYSGNRLPGIPTPESNSRLDLTGRIWDVGLQHIFTGEQWMTDANDLRYGSYHLFHFQAGWEPELPGTPLILRIYGGIRNIFDTQYASMILINAPSFGASAPRYYYPGNPRNFFIGIRLGFEKKG